MRIRGIDTPSILALALLTFWLGSLVAALGTARGFITDARGIPVERDFVGFYTAGKLAVAGEPAAAYDWSRHKAAQHDLLQNPESGHYPWAYPPVFLLVAAPLAALPFAMSMLTWIIATGAALTFALYRISETWRDFLLMLAAPAAWLNAFVGQNGALSAALIGLGLCCLPSRPVLAGLLIGILSFKPHLGLLIPVALLAGGYYRAFTAAGLTVTLLAAATVAVFGPEPWLALPDQLSRISEVLAASWSFEKIQSIYGLTRAVGASAGTAFAMQMTVIAALIGGISWVWRRHDIAYDLKAASLAAAVTLASPYQFVYDLVILTIAQAFLLRHLATTPAGIAEVAGLTLANVLVFMFARTAVPLGIAGAAVVMILIARRIALDRQAQRSDPLRAAGPADHHGGHPLGSPVPAPYGAARISRHDPRG